MKLNKNKIVVSALALAIGTSLAGSIGSTIAWYQYSTRANVSYLGTSAGASGNLQLRIANYSNANNVWADRLTIQQIDTYLASVSRGQKVQPITFGAMGKDDTLPNKCYVNPVPGKGPYAQWTEAGITNYVQIPLELRYNERDGVKENDIDDKEVEKDVYLSKLLIKGDYTNAANDKKDLSNAIRVHISSYQSNDNSDGHADTLKNKLISNIGGTTFTSAKLDLDDDGRIDRAYTLNTEEGEFGFGEGNSYEEITYGEGVQTSYANAINVVENKVTHHNQTNNEEIKEDVLPSIVKTVDNSFEIQELEYSYNSVDHISKSIGKLVANETNAQEHHYLNVVVTIWVEGWQEFLAEKEQPTDPDKYESIWDGGYIDSKFDIGIQFAVQDAFAE